MEAIRKERLRRATDRAREEAAKRGSVSLYSFVEMAWHVLEPGTPFVPTWHVQAICEHLEAAARGEITRLQINVPPGFAKSLLVSVMWNAFVWGPMGRPHTRWLSTSFAEKNVRRDTRKTRDLILSEWYQDLWGERVQLKREAETSFENEQFGAREASSFGSLTSKRGDFLTIDDPHSTETAESEVERETATRIFRESVPRRINNALSVIAVIMQRLHAKDICGVIEELGLPYTKLILPMEFDPARRCTTMIAGKVFFQDPRTHDGELLAPSFYGPHQMAADKKAMTSFAWAGQMQQRPSPREGGLFKRDWLPVVAKAPPLVRVCRHWDLAATEESYGNDPAWTAGVKIGTGMDGRYYVLHVVRLRAEGPAVRRVIMSTAESDRYAHGDLYEISGPQDPGAAGKVLAQDYVTMLAGFNVHFWKETGDKLSRAEPFAAQAENKNVSVVAGEWNEIYIDELVQAPGGKYMDQLDASSGAFTRLTRRRLQQHQPGPRVIPLMAR